MPPSKQSISPLAVAITTLFAFNMLFSGWCPVYAQAKVYSVHIDSFKAVNNAVNRVSDLKAKGIDAFCRYEKAKDKGYWYRVYVGRFGSKKEAEDMATSLTKQKIVPRYLISEVKEGGTNFCLHVSSYIVRAQAEDEVSRLQKLGII